MSMRARLIFSYIGSVLTIFLLTSVYLNRSLKPLIDNQITSELEAKANLTRQFLSTSLPHTFNHDSVDPIIDKLGKASPIRLTFIGIDGTVWGDTERVEDALKRMANQRNHPEIRAALFNGHGTAERFNATTNTTLRFFALPVFRENQLIGVCRVALPLNRIQPIISRFRNALLLASGTGLVVTIFLSYVTTETITRPIRRLTQTIQSIARGEITSRVSGNSNDELGQLFRHFNQMADSVQSQICTISHERDRLVTILENMVEEVLLIDKELAIVYANSAAITMLNLPENYRAHPLIELIRHPELQRLLAESRNTRNTTFAEIRFAGSIERETEVTAVPLVDQYLVVIHDVSQLRQLERVRVDFVANVSHEMRTPLTSIQGYAETLLNGALEDSSANSRFVGKILQQSSQLSQLVSNLLDLSRLESGMATLNLEPCTLEVFHEYLLNLFSRTLQSAKLQFVWEVPNDLPPLSGDKRLLGQAFSNLLDNAIKYTRTGGSITVSAELIDTEIHVHTRDTGIGIPSHILPRIFERFYRADKARSSEISGSGLGLAIAKHILLQHDGRIWADSILGQGSVFHFAVPIWNDAGSTRTL